jgi:hypothetical protein
MQPTETLRTDWTARISLAAFLDDTMFASIMSRRTPARVRLGYTTSDKSHSWLLGTRQIGQGYIERAPNIVVARVLT